MSDFGWKVNLDLSNIFIANVSNDFGFNSIKKNQLLKKIPI